MRKCAGSIALAAAIASGAAIADDRSSFDELMDYFQAEEVKEAVGEIVEREGTAEGRGRELQRYLDDALRCYDRWNSRVAQLRCLEDEGWR